MLQTISVFYHLNVLFHSGLIKKQHLYLLVQVYELKMNHQSKVLHLNPKKKIHSNRH
ncbi:hypothetical protein K8B81_15920 [Flavobacterium hibisci]|nr:hypothetical protein [Flavobacterium hibisci]